METKININVQSEIGKLDAVLLHRPGAEVENMTPMNVQRALYSDILNLSIAQKEYEQLSGVLSKVAKVYEVQSLLEKVLEQQVNPGICEGADLKVVYTPLNGAGNKLCRRIMDKIGVSCVEVVKEQEMPDGNFTTCPYPNPEIKEALQKGLELSQS
jgi:phosphoglucomutase